MTDRELMQQALEALEAASDIVENYTRAGYEGEFNEAITALRERLAQPEPYDQTELELCKLCGWKTLIPGDCCLNCALEAQPEQEPVAWMFEDDEDNGHKTFRQTPPSPEAVAYLAKWNRPAWVPLYTSPPAQRTWVGLTEPERLACYDLNPARFASAIEAKLKEKNT